MLNRKAWWAALLALSGTAGNAWAQEPAPAPGVPLLPPGAPTAPPLGPPGAAPQVERLYTEEQLRAIIQEELARAKAEEEAAQPADKKEEKPSGPEEHVVGDDFSLKPTWKNGFEVQSADKAFRFKPRGRFQMDGTLFSSNDALEAPPIPNAGGFAAPGGGVGPLRDAVNPRRARLGAEGTLWEVYDFTAEFDFINTTSVTAAPVNPTSPANSNVFTINAVTDLWVQVRELPVVGSFRIGSFKDPIGMEHLTSSRFLDFMERSFLQDAFFGPFNNGFVPGAMFTNTAFDERMTWAAGVFKNTTNIFDSSIGSGETALTSRLTFLPYYRNEGRELVHIGIAGSHRDTDDGVARVRSRASLRSGAPGPLNPVLADTANFFADDQDLIACEMAIQRGPLLIQGEYTGSFFSDVDQVSGNTCFVHGGYIEALWFLTGEHRDYSRKAGVFERVVPYENFFFVRDDRGQLCSGRGAWQLGARYSRLDLNDGSLQGGTLHDVTLGLNWFLNPNLKWQWNYVGTRRDSVVGNDGTFHGVGSRIAFDF